MKNDQQYAYNSLTGEWNDSLRGEFLWSSVNTREAVPNVMTPSTWSLWQIYYIEDSPVKLPEKHPFVGYICGRPYLNLSLVVSMYRAVGKDVREEMHGDIIGSAQSDLDIPIIPSIADQFYWGERVRELGMGLPFIPRPKLTRDRLSIALKELSSNGELHATASILGEKIRAENGVKNAVRLIEEVFR